MPETCDTHMSVEDRETLHLRLHIGCGPKVRRHGLIYISSYEDITLDLREPFPFPENFCSVIYSEQFSNILITHCTPNQF